MGKAASFLPALRGRDAWLLLAKARRELVAGCWQAAVDTYNRAEESFGPSSAAAVCRRERCAVEIWIGPGDPHPGGWSGRLRQSLTPQAPEPEGTAPSADAMTRLVTAMTEISRGTLAEGRERLQSICTDGTGGPIVLGYARLGSVRGECSARRTRQGGDYRGHGGDREVLPALAASGDLQPRLLLPGHD